MKMLSLLLLLGVVLILSACSKDEPTVEPVAKPAPAVAPVVVPAVELGLGEQVYNKSCSSCHKSGIAGSPKVGDTQVWASRIAGGKEQLVNNAINGIGTMRAKGGHASLTDAEVAAAVDFMVEQSQ